MSPTVSPQTPSTPKTAASPARTPARVFDEPAVQSRLIDLSRTLLYETLDGNADACLPLFAEEALWFGPTAGRTDHTIADFRELCRDIRRQGLRVILSAMTWEAIAHHDPALCTVIVQCVVHWGLGGKDAAVVARPMRVGFLWKRCDAATVRIAAVDVGFLLDERSDADAAYDAVASGRVRIEVRDTEGNGRYLDADEIVYLQAKGRQTIVHTLDGSFTSPESIGDFQERLDGRFVRLHRTYLINGWFVKSLSARGAVMADGAVLPVPARRLVALRAELGAIKKPATLTVRELESAVRSAMADVDAS